MKRLTAIAIVAAAVLGCSFNGAQAAQGKVETAHFVCGDSFIQFTTTDKTISGGSINDRNAVFATLEHGAEKGRATVNLLLLTSMTPDNQPGEGYVFKSTKAGGFYMQAATFAADQTKSTGLSYTVSGPKTECSEG